MKGSSEGAVVRLVITGLALGLVIAGCGKGDDDTSTSTSSSAATSVTSATSTTSSAEAGSETSAAPTTVLAPTAYYPLLMAPESVPPTPAGPFTGDGPSDHSKDGAPDVRQNYTSGDNSILSTIEAFPDAEAASAYAKATIDAMGSQITGTPEPAPNVTTDAMVINGTSKDGSASMSALVFSEENTVVTLIFLGKAGDPVSPDYLDSVGVIQLDAIQQGLPGLGE